MRLYVKENDTETMRKGSKGGTLGNTLTLLIFALVLTCAVAVYSQPPPIPQGAICDECGMAIDRDSKFAASVIDKKGGKFFFCDTGDMLYHLKKTKMTVQSVYVRDYASGEWIDGEKAWYVLNKKFVTPMYWGIVAFRSDAEAKKWGHVVDFNSAFGLIK